jgi:hypothetical protein
VTEPVVHSLDVGHPNGAGAFMIFCPGCQCGHRFNHGAPQGPNWDFNGDMVRPTINPSLLVTGTQKITDEEHRRIMAGEQVTPRPLRCHSWIRDGNIQFLDDCTHELRNKTVPLAPF